MRIVFRNLTLLFVPVGDVSNRHFFWLRIMADKVETLLYSGFECVGGYSEMSWMYVAHNE